MSVTNEIKERLDIVELISSYVPLKKAGRSYQGLCPFHNEKTPSFFVFPDTQSWRCFGCNSGGDAYDFVMKREGLSFAEALKMLAERAGVPLPERQGAPAAEEQRLGRLREALATAAGYFHHLLLHSSEAERARIYLDHRGFTRATWEAWQLGYAPDQWEGLRNHLLAKGFSLEELEAAGLVIRREDNSGYYDRFRGRLMIPIRDQQARTIGFGGRILVEDKERPQPKYINSPQTALFDKGKVLFGMDMARKAMRDANLGVLVEGYMDVMMSHQVGVCNVVAGMGTALTDAQLQQIKSHAKNITLALDPDTAGEHATLRGIDAAREVLDKGFEAVIDPRGLVRREGRMNAQLRIATLPDGLDPDELAYRDVARWREVIAQARPVVDYFLDLVAREEDLTSARGKANAVARVVPVIREVANPVEREHYINVLARLVQTDERLIAAEIAGGGRPAGQSRRRSEPAATPAPAPAIPAGQREAPSSSPAEDHILGHLLLRPEFVVLLDAHLLRAHAQPLGEKDLTSGENRAILAALQAGQGPGLETDPEAVLELLPEALHDRCRELMAQTQQEPPLVDDALLKDLGDRVLRLRERRLQESVGRLRFLLAELPEEEHREQRQEYSRLVAAYTAQVGQVHKLLNARSMTGALKRTRH